LAHHNLSLIGEVARRARACHVLIR